MSMPGSVPPFNVELFFSRANSLALSAAAVGGRSVASILLGELVRINSLTQIGDEGVEQAFRPQAHILVEPRDAPLILHIDRFILDVIDTQTVGTTGEVPTTFIENRAPVSFIRAPRVWIPTPSVAGSNPVLNQGDLIPICGDSAISGSAVTLVSPGAIPDETVTADIRGNWAFDFQAPASGFSGVQTFTILENATPVLTFDLEFG